VFELSERGYTIGAVSNRARRPYLFFGLAVVSVSYGDGTQRRIVARIGT
jgi:hypothetical protein